MSIENHLTNGENILARLDQDSILGLVGQHKKYYATNKRVIKYDKWLSETFSDLPYTHITTVNFESKYNFGRIVLGFVIAIFGGLIITKNTIITDLLLSITTLLSITITIPQISGLILLIIGIFIIVFLYKNTHIRLLSSGLVDEEAGKWEICSSYEHAAEFIKIVRSNLRD